MRVCEWAGGERSEKEAEKTCKDLKEYCGLDKEGMVEIVEKLGEIIQSKK